MGGVETTTSGAITQTCCLGLRARSTERLKSQIPSCQGEGTTPLWEGGLSRSHLRKVTSVDSPLDSFLGQHVVSSKKSYTTNNSQVLQSLKHVQVGPVDVHQPQHGCNQMARNTVTTVLNTVLNQTYTTLIALVFSNPSDAFITLINLSDLKLNQRRKTDTGGVE